MRTKSRLLSVAIMALYSFAIGTHHLGADIVEFKLTGNAGDGLLPGNVSPSSGSTGSGGIGFSGITFDTASQIIHFDFHWGSANGFSDLSGNVNMLHFHGPTALPAPGSFDQTAPVYISMTNSAGLNPSASGGGLIENYFINTSDVPLLMQGRFYINVHTPGYPLGEIRGYLVVVPEPASFFSMFSILALGMCRRTRRLVAK